MKRGAERFEPWCINMIDQAELTILLCPGQGAQQVGMGKSWFDSSPAAAEVFTQADERLGIELSKVCFEGPKKQLDRTDLAQMAIYVTSVACYRASVEDGRLEPGQITATAGLSLGEFTSLYVAGAFDFSTGLDLVRLRGEAMQAAADSIPSGMIALMGVDEEQAQALCDAARDDDVLVPANFNCPGQVVVSGSRDACTRAVGVAQEMGLKAKSLSVAGAFHSPLMEPAAGRLAQALDQADWHCPKISVVSNVTGRPHDLQDIASIKALLIRQLTSPVQWTQSMQWLIHHTSGHYVELDPGKALSGLMRRIDRSVKVQNFERTAVS